MDGAKGLYRKASSFNFMFEISSPLMFSFSMATRTSTMILSSAVTFFLALVFFFLRKQYAKLQKKSYDDFVKSEEKIEAEADLPPVPDFDINTTKPRPYRPWKPGKFAMTMGIRKMPEDDWLLLDNQYMKEQEFRRYLLKEKRNGVMQYLPGSEDACMETLNMIVDFLTKRYPHYFVFSTERPGYLHNRITDLKYKVTEPLELPPLEVAAQLVMEDINLLFQGAGPDPDQHYL